MNNRDTRQEKNRQLRRLIHEMRTHLSIVSMGMDSVEGVRKDPDRLAALVATIHRDGLEPLIGIVDALDALAAREQE